ncbi:MAG: hypothetical protein UT05_C0002G0079 [Parcubacteria group bacterium GW2011_GWF2_38_76]|nr:MAG: hypothetical protein UT05_C0002G0079 [Parcubacteria group bacterium GW2011_GWF2_38_76]HBM45763.1 hypothetical protein [Patescibacteria group bacterium]
MLKIAVINPGIADGLARTILDGLVSLTKRDSSVSFKYANTFPYAIEGLEENQSKDKKDFIDFAKEANLIFFIWAKRDMDIGLANEIGLWDKTIFIDGSEIGKNGRYNFEIQHKIIKGEYSGSGKIDTEMLHKCPLYFRREKPYKDGIVPFPFGIESLYVKDFSLNTPKDIDFFCVFGQDEYPLMRRYSREILIDFCKKNGFTCFTEKTDRDNFYRTLARSKVGISVGGGGYDCMRFWEILGNNCLMLTEKIDIYEPDSKKLKYDRIWQFNDLFDFEYQLEKMGEYLRKEYDQSKLKEEYRKVMSEHSSEARVLEIIEKAKEIKLL